ncbi:MAG: GAF domain-containing protein [Chloroflexota bacterium]|nr:GAF domain-containing protein [Chloroflexota bacterium]
MRRPSPIPPGPVAPDAVLRHAVDEAARLLSADGAIVFLLDPPTGRLRWAQLAGASTSSERSRLRSLELEEGVGMFHRALAEGQVLVADEYLADETFQHSPPVDAFARDVGLQSLVVAPMIANGEPLGGLGAFSVRRAAFGEPEAALLRALADHAAVTMANARLIGELGRSTAELSRRADAERALREIAARIAAISDAGEILERVVDEAKRLVGADAARLWLTAESGRQLVPAVLAGGGDSETRAWPKGVAIRVAGGSNWPAARLAGPVSNAQSDADSHLSPRADDQKIVDRSALRGVAAAHMRGPEGEILGTLAVMYPEPRELADDEVELLQGLADQAAIALTNARLYEELRRSEERYRYLLENSPDLVWSTDEAGRLTFLSETCERLTGWKPQELLGQHFGILIHASSAEDAARTWNDAVADPSRQAQFRINLRHRDGHAVPTEVHAVAIEVDGRFAGAHGALRDMSERDRLERDLRRQEAELAAEWERANLARELHDSVTQVLFSMTLTTRSVEMLLRRDPAAAAEKLAELRDLERDALAEMRALIFELRPGGLEHGGLVQALRTHSASVEGRTGLPVAVEAAPIQRLPEAVENGLYRIGQEALHNVVKHASARQARMSLTVDRDVVRLVVADDGRGFDPGAVAGDQLGLAGMRARAERIGGTLQVKSRLGEGTRVEVSVPFAASMEATSVSE